MSSELMLLQHLQAAVAGFMSQIYFLFIAVNVRVKHCILSKVNFNISHHCFKGTISSNLDCIVVSQTLKP